MKFSTANQAVFTVFLSTIYSVLAQDVQNDPFSSSTIAASPAPTVAPTGFSEDGNQQQKNNQSWISQNHRYVFIIIIALLFLAIIIWYIVRSVRGMRTRLTRENNQNMMLIQNTRGADPRNNIPEAIPVPMDSFHKVPEYSPQNNQQAYTHRY
jgi:flagellar biosynthesis/type III secretory pathway M-ring protein FliF/YscJ